MGAPPCIKNGWIFHGELLNNQMVASGKLRVCHLEAMAIDLDRGFTQKMVDLPIVFLYVYHGPQGAKSVTEKHHCGAIYKREYADILGSLWRFIYGNIWEYLPFMGNDMHKYATMF